jgi:hypothetical protein
MKREVIILDTNIWISYLLSRKYHILTNLILSNRLDVVTYEILINEFSEVLHREKFSKYLKIKDIGEAIKIHLKLCRFVEVEIKTDYLTDKKDNYLIDLYQFSSATFLVTGDKQILEQAPKFGINAISLKQFEAQAYNV